MKALIIIGLVVVGLFGAILISVRLRRFRENQDPQSREDRLRREAQRFSWRIVSELKQHNEARVEDGRQSHDLYYQLREQLEGARKLYEKSVDWAAADRDYFHEAVVEVLCDGDPEALGREYPGPRGHTLQ